MAKEKVGLMEAISIGIGGMVGGGIFAVLGLAVSLSRGGTPVAFLFAGLIALLTSYSYAKLSIHFPSRGGTVKFMNVSFGKGVLSGGLNNLLWFSYIIMLSLYASAFGSYAPNIFRLTNHLSWDNHIYLSLVIILATAINYYSIEVVGKIESYAVGVKLFILLSFVGLGFYGLVGNENLTQLSLSDWESPLSLLTGGMVIFVAYEGFELIANVASDIENPKKNIPKAYYYSVLFVIALYLAISIITVGSLPFDQIKEAKDYVLAEAAKPMLGQWGFTIITVAALISTFSAINASLYGGTRVSYELGEDDEAPHELTKLFWNHPVGLAITSIVTLLIANTLALESISTAGSLGFLLIFTMVNLAAFRESKKIKSKKTITLLAVTLCFVAFGTLAFQQLGSNPEGAIAALGIIFMSFVFEFIYKRMLNK